MAIDPEELKRRRAQRAQERAKQAAAWRKTMIGLGVAAAVLVACGILIFILARRNAPAPVETLPVETTIQGVQEATQPAETASAVTTVHFTAAGNMNITDDVVAAGGDNYDYTAAFMDVAHLLAEADLTAMNFEGNLCGAPYGADSAPETLAKALDRAGVDYLQLANSYAISRGLSGLGQTLRAVRSAGMEPLGAYADPDEAKAARGYTICNINGVKIGLVAFTKGMGGLTLPADGEGCVNVLYEDYDSTYQTIDTEKITAILSSLNKEKPDIVIAFLHWGSEKSKTVSASQRAIAELMQNNGVDAIIGTHPHSVLDMEFDPQNGTFVAYSLGDFFGGNPYSVILDLQITKDNITGETKVTGFDYTPIFTLSQEGKPVKVVRIQQAMQAYESGYLDAVSDETYQAMAQALSELTRKLQEAD